MSYTTRDYLHDMHPPVPQAQVDEMIGRGLCVVRRADLEALIAFAEAHGLDTEVESQWDDDDRSDALLAMANWRKDRRDWEPE